MLNGFIGLLLRAIPDIGLLAKVVLHDNLNIQRNYTCICTILSLAPQINRICVRFLLRPTSNTQLLFGTVWTMNLSGQSKNGDSIPTAELIIAILVCLATLV